MSAAEAFNRLYKGKSLNNDEFGLGIAPSSTKKLKNNKKKKRNADDDLKKSLSS